MRKQISGISHILCNCGLLLRFVCVCVCAHPTCSLQKRTRRRIMGILLVLPLRKRVRNQNAQICISNHVGENRRHRSPKFSWGSCIHHSFHGGSVRIFSLTCTMRFKIITYKHVFKTTKLRNDHMSVTLHHLANYFKLFT